MYHKEVHEQERNERWEHSPANQPHSQHRGSEKPVGWALQARSNGGLEQQHICREYFSIVRKFPKVPGALLPSNSVGQQPAKCTVTTKLTVPLTALVDVACQTYSTPPGTLTILLSATDGAEASTQVCHTRQMDKVTDTDNG